MGGEGVVKFVSSALAPGLAQGVLSQSHVPGGQDVSQLGCRGWVELCWSCPGAEFPSAPGPLRSMVEDLQSEESDDDDSSSGEEAAVKANPVSRDSRW